MVNSVEGFCKMKGDHSTGTTPIDSLVNIIKEIHQAGTRGVATPESRLSLWQQIVIFKICNALLVNNPFKYFTNCRDDAYSPKIIRIICRTTLV